MKNKIQLSIALAIALVLSLIGLNVWAAPERQGTVPVFPDLIPITALIPVTGGTYQVELLCDCPYEGLVIRIPDPEEQIGSAPEDQKYLSDAVAVELEGACNIEICYPYPSDYEKQKGQLSCPLPLCRKGPFHGPCQFQGGPLHLKRSNGAGYSSRLFLQSRWAKN